MLALFDHAVDMLILAYAVLAASVLFVVSVACFAGVRLIRR